MAARRCPRSLVFRSVVSGASSTGSRRRRGVAGGGLVSAAVDDCVDAGSSRTGSCSSRSSAACSGASRLPCACRGARPRAGRVAAPFVHRAACRRWATRCAAPPFHPTVLESGPERFSIRSGSRLARQAIQNPCAMTPAISKPPTIRIRSLMSTRSSCSPRSGLFEQRNRRNGLRYTAAIAAASSTSTVTSRETPGSFIVTPIR